MWYTREAGAHASAPFQRALFVSFETAIFESPLVPPTPLLDSCARRSSSPPLWPQPSSPSPWHRCCTGFPGPCGLRPRPVAAFPAGDHLDGVLYCCCVLIPRAPRAPSDPLLLPPCCCVLLPFPTVVSGRRRGAGPEHAGLHEHHRVSN